MRIYWYWPFAREEDVALALATPGDGDLLVVDALDRPGAPRIETDSVIVRARLPEVDGTREGSVRWAASRARTYRSRSQMRRQAVASGGFDVCHVAFLNQYTDIFDLRRLARVVPLVTTVHDVLPHRSRLPLAIQHRVLDRLYRVCGTIIVHHDDVKTELLERFAIPNERVHVVPHWVSPFRDPDDRRQLSSDPTVLFFGTLRSNKGIEVLLDVIERFGPTPGMRFHIAGRGDAQLERDVLALARRNPALTAEIGWITPERKIELLRNADLVVLPYTSFSSQSGVLHDACGSHLPVVATDVGALRSSVERTGAGWVVQPNSVEELMAAIAHAFSDEQDWQRAADGAREVAIDQSPERVGAALRAVYAAAARR